MLVRFQVGDRVVHYDDDKMSFPEARWVKRETGLVGLEFIEAARKLDPDALLAIYALALRRDGMDIEHLDDVPLDADNGYMELLDKIIPPDEPTPNRATRRANGRRPVAKT